MTASAGFSSRAKVDHTGRPNEDRCVWEKIRKGVYYLAGGQTVILLHPPLPSVGVSIGVERGVPAE